MNFVALQYNIIGEVITCVFALILCCNILVSFSLYDRRHRLFFYGGVASFLSAFFDIFAVICITNYKNFPIPLSTAVSTLFFIFLIAIPFFLASYANDVAFAYKKCKKYTYCLSGVVYGIYLLIVLLNIKTGWIFRYDPELGYVRGPLKYLTYVLTLWFSIITVLVVALNKKSIARRLYYVFMIYPFVSIFFLVFQFLDNTVLLTGISSFSALFFAYITLQSDLMEFDLVTGLMTESKLRKHVSLKNTSGVLYVLSIDNMNNIQSNMEVTSFNTMLLNLGKELSKYFERNTYHISTNRFAGICKTKDEAVQYSKAIEKYIYDLNNSLDTVLSSPLEIYSSSIVFSKGEVSYDSLIEIINNMLVKCKNDGSRKMQICDEAILVEMERKRYIHKVLKRELRLDSEQFQVWYQPIYSLSEKKFTYMEALSRLNNTELGNIPPGEFVGVAESRGLIEKLGFVAFEKVCKFIAENRNLVKAVSINFSVYQMTNTKVVENVLGTIARFGLSPSNIIMEITESIFIENFELVLNNMKKLAEAGIKFYLDDFGTGYSNLSNVIALPFSTIKIDRTLVLMAEESKKGEHLFSNLISTFKDAELTILVEGVETNNQNYLVEKSGADLIQGFLYSRPLPPEDCIELLQKQAKL